MSYDSLALIGMEQTPRHAGARAARLKEGN